MLLSLEARVQEAHDPTAAAKKIKMEEELEKMMQSVNNQRARRIKAKAREKYPEKILEAQKRYREKNTNKIAESKKRYNETNKEKIREYQRQYREKNRERIRENRRRYFERYRETLSIQQRNIERKMLKSGKSIIDNITRLTERFD